MWRALFDPMMVYVVSELRCSVADPFDAWFVSALHLRELLAVHTLSENTHEDLSQRKLGGC